MTNWRDVHGIDCRDPQPGECLCGAVSPRGTAGPAGGRQAARGGGEEAEKVSELAPTFTGYRLFMDGNAWCAVGPHFKCLAIDPAGFGETEEAAVAALNADEGHRTWLRRINGQPAKLEDFKIESQKEG